MTRHFLLVVLLHCCPLLSSGQAEGPTVDGEVARHRMDTHHVGKNRIRQDAWLPFQDGFTREQEVMVCENGNDAKQQRGIHQTVTLNQKRPQLVIATLQSKAENAGGTSDNFYSLYLDLTFTDGTHLWGQATPFDTGTHDWQTRKVVIVPPKPIKHIAFYAMFKQHTGTAWFRNAHLTSQPLPADRYRLEGQHYVQQGATQEGIQIREVGREGEFVHLRKEALGLQMKVHKSTHGGATFFDLALRDTTGRDRAITLAYCLPLREKTAWWLQDPRVRQRVDKNSQYSLVHRFEGVGSEKLSPYPIAAVASDRAGTTEKAEAAMKGGTAVGIDMSRPAFYRLVYHSKTNEMLLLFDLGFTPEKPTARLRFCRYSFDPEWGFRAALDRYYQLFPEAFRNRATHQGTWMPFAKISEVKDWEDFGFAFKEGTGETAWDDANGITTFRYTEPMTWWMTMPPEMPRTIEAATAEARRLAKEGNAQAQALLTSGFHDEDGKFAGKFRNTPWSNGIVWSMNSTPGVTGGVTDFSHKWNPSLMKKLYGSDAKGHLDGEYFDSAEGYVTAPLNYRRDHFPVARTPLCYSSATHRPGIFRGQVAYEYMRSIAKDVHQNQGLTMANATPIRLCWYAPLLDVMGTETNWNRDGQWNPMSDSDLLYRRVMCKGKPYCFLMNTDFAKFTHAMSQKYMQRCLAYGMFPGFFSHNASEDHYFSTPDLYNRDRDLFKKYLPLCQRVAEAGWEPITQVTCDNDQVHLERFGDRYLTVFNSSDQEQATTLRLAHPWLAGSQDLVSGQSVQWKGGTTPWTLAAESVAVFTLRRSADEN